MARHIIALLLGTMLGAVAWAAQGDEPGDYGLLDTQYGLLGPYQENAYGLGVHMDATGRPFRWEVQGPVPVAPDPLLRVTPNVYGPGIGMDQYGRPVWARPLNR